MIRLKSARIRLVFLTAFLVAVGLLLPGHDFAAQKSDEDEPPEKIVKSEIEWKKLLTKEQYRVTRKKGTETAFTGKYWNSKKLGVYHCVCCDLPLFSSETKFDSGTGWPSFTMPIRKTAVAYHDDRSMNDVRTEVVCNRCDAHLGHVFADGPAPTGMRFCMNSASLKHVAPAKDGKKSKP